MTGVVLFGVRSPLVTEYEESCHRAGWQVLAGVSVEGAPRMIDASLLVELGEADERLRGRPYLACAFTPRRRRALADRAEALGLTAAPPLIDPTAITARKTRIGDGSFVNAGCIIGTVVLVGENVVVNRGASLGHHSVLEDDVSLGPGVTIAGNVRIGQGTVIGTGSTILPDIRIGRDCIVAAGSVVRQEVPDGTFVAGNPAMARSFDWNRSSLNMPGSE
jgi:sugar O-acyltransferase (sialic acid O-acetyltransferase NeuD family)